MEESVAEPIAPTPRNFAIPGCVVTIVNDEDGNQSIEDLLAIVFNLASANPGTKVDFWIKMLP